MNAALEKRAKAFAELRSVQDDTRLTAGEREERAARINAEIDSLGEEAERYVRQAELEAEHRSLNERAAGRGGGRSRTEWRNGLLPTAEEYRALLATSSTGEAAVPTKVATRYREPLAARSAFLNAPGLALETLMNLSKITPESGHHDPPGGGATRQ